MGKYNGYRGCKCSKCQNHNNNNDYVETITSPTRQIVRNTTDHRTVRYIHPTKIKNVHRTIVRNENYYPVSESDFEETVVENYDCGSDVNDSSNCRRVGSESNGNGNGNSNGCHKKRHKDDKERGGRRHGKCCGHRKHGFI
ncbi:spore coat protein [Oceanobacillus sp. 1P07AA]|uniref:spore coat protein n=1 Tax=Oceanobacillus sp. 1P07AA TaxID=3132293 RepID=UPI0039A6A721